MRVRGRFILLFMGQAIVAALASLLFAFASITGEGARAEAELRSISPTSFGSSPSAARALDKSLSEAERLGAALEYAKSLAASAAAARLYRSQAAIEAAAKIGGFSLAWAGLAALAFAIGSRSFTRRLDELVAGAARVASDRSFRLPPIRDREFAPVYEAMNRMLDRIAEEERILAESASLAGWKEVSSFLFHQLRTPLSSIELAARNVALAAGGQTLAAEAALQACSTSAASAIAECARIRALLERFKSLSGLALAAPTAVKVEELVATLASRIAPERARVVFSGQGLGLLLDRRMAEEALLNLAINAADACPHPPAQVRVACEIEGDFVLIIISDSNGRVDPSLFERSGRERFTTKPEGTGLGLLFVRRVAALHGGDLELYPGEDGGFRATIRLPRTSVAAASALALAEAAAAAKAGVA